MLLATASLVAFLVFAASVDVGCFVVARATLRRIVDSAALAGARHLADRVCRDHNRRLAVASARTSAHAHLVRLSQQPGVKTNVEVGNWDFNVETFTANSARPASVNVAAESVSARLLFAPFIGLGGQTVNRRSIAVIEPRNVVYVFSERNAITDKAIHLLIRDCRRDADLLGSRQTAYLVREPNGWQVLGDQSAFGSRLKRVLAAQGTKMTMRDACSIAWQSLLQMNSGDPGIVIQVKQRKHGTSLESESRSDKTSVEDQLKAYVVSVYDPTDKDRALSQGRCDRLHIIDDRGHLLHLNLRELSLDHRVHLVYTM